MCSSDLYKRQGDVARDIARQIAGGSKAIFGLMLESNLVEGRQDLVSPGDLIYGQSITDGCIGWDATASLLDELAAAVRQRRKARTL